MRRLLAGIALLLALPLIAVFGLGADGGGSGYKVKALFDNVAAAVPGEDVKIAGAKVGVIESLDVTDDNKAEVVLRIDDSRFTPFRRDARCTIRPQSLIGEKFVECEPGTATSEPLRDVGEDEHALPLDRTSSPVDLDLVNDTLRRPQRERLALLLGELGVGLAGRGEELNEVIHRANPALRETDKVLEILAGQNKVLGKLAEDSDTVLAPLAREKERVSDFIAQANEVGQASAERRGDIEASIERLPGFLRELRPYMADLGGLADEMTPVLRDLNAAAPDVSRLITQLGPFSSAARPALRSLGAATERGRPALIRTRPLIQDLRRFATDAGPVSRNLDDLTKSLDKTGGIERLMDYLFFQMIAINGFDGLGHYLRAGLIVNLCSTYAIAPTAGCNANFTDTRAIASSGGRVDPRLADTRAALQAAMAGEQGTPEEREAAARRKLRGSVPPAGTLFEQLVAPNEDSLREERQRRLEELRRQSEQPSPGLGGAEPLLDYLLGDDQ
jgi:phospholipid/cholesterol/gamma-HCH transport system substrate-binding protein